MGIQMYVSLSVGMWRTNRNPNPCTDLNEILNPHPHLPKEGFGSGLTPLHLGLRGLKPEKLMDTFLKTVYKTKDVQQVAN